MKKQIRTGGIGFYVLILAIIFMAWFMYQVHLDKGLITAIIFINLKKT